MRVPAAELLKPGDPVRLFGSLRGTKDGKGRIVRGTVEYGVVVRVADAVGWQDCYVAFSGFKKPPGRYKALGDKPYILRYHYTSLVKEH